MNEAELTAFAEMAIKVRERFEIDKEFLVQSKDLSTDVQALGELKRSLRIKRRLARRKRTVHNTIVWKGFETNTKSCKRT